MSAVRPLCKQTDVTVVTASNVKSVAPDVPESNEPRRAAPRRSVKEAIREEEDPSVVARKMSQYNKTLYRDIFLATRLRGRRLNEPSVCFCLPYRDLVPAVDLSGPQRQSDHRASGRVALHDDRRAFEPRGESPLLSSSKCKTCPITFTRKS